MQRLDDAAQAVQAIEPARWLAEGEAADIVFSGEPAPKKAALA